MARSSAVRKHTEADAAPAPKKAALAVVPKSNPVSTIEPPKLTKKFISEAERADKAIVKQIETIGLSFTALARMFAEAKLKGYHVALGFPTFVAYLEARYPDKSKSQVYEAIRVVQELGSGDKPLVKDEDLDGMTISNAKSLVDLKKEGVKITPKLIEGAKTLPAKRFQTELVLPAAPKLAARAAAAAGHTIAGGAEVLMPLRYLLTAGTIAAMSRAAEIAKYVTRGMDESLDFSDRFLQSMCAEYEAAHGPEYEEFMRTQEAEAANAAVTHDERMHGGAAVEEAEEVTAGDEDEEAHAGAGGDGGEDEGTETATDEDEPEPDEGEGDEEEAEQADDEN